jgi:hypothetical protein
MPHASPSIGAIAAALAKAQGELTNPEKSLLATIRSPIASEGERSFRYASLASGLDIVRKVLGKHGIAIVQTTAIDREAALIWLTTVLAHSSGEWLSSDWPVCGVGETAAPHKMGAALTYARRYALFTLVGIAGEDDLDAPDLIENQLGVDIGAGRQSDNGNGQADATLAARIGPKERGSRPRPALKAAAELPAEQSAAILDRLLGEVAVLPSADAAASWAQEGIRAKNGLTGGDAKRVEAAFAARLAELAADDAQIAPAREPTSAPAAAAPLAAPVAPENPAPTGIDKSVLVVAEPRRHRNKEHLRFVTKQACLVCGRKHSDPHHLGFMQPRALGRKVSDEFAVPLCRIHHREVHRASDEPAWWRRIGVEPVAVARKLWEATRRRNGGLLHEPADPSGAETLRNDGAGERGPS